jgi:hypothetical protein
MIIRHAESPVKTHPEYGFLFRTALTASRRQKDEGRLRSTILPICSMRGTLRGFPGTANLPIGVLLISIRKMVFPGRIGFLSA